MYDKPLAPELAPLVQACDVVVGMRMGQSHNEKITAQVERLNRVVHQTILSSRFITLFYAEIEDTGNITYVNAGHCPPLLMTPAGEALVASARSARMSITTPEPWSKATPTISSTRSLTGSASSSLERVLTSTKTTILPSSAIKSISPAGHR